jgi:hypothetical protein
MRRHPGRRRGQALSAHTHEATNVGTDRSQLSHVANEAKETMQSPTVATSCFFWPELEPIEAVRV